MIKTFIFGIVLGIAGVITALWFVPAVDQYREASIISVTPNGGNAEVFHVNIPMDRIMIGAQGQEGALPPGMLWPEDETFANTRAELFKLRNSRDAVVGVASRLASRDDRIGDVIEWVLHLPARGTLYVTMNPSPVDGARIGQMRAGTREFETLLGRLRERWVANTSTELDGQAGRIELSTTFVSTEMPELAIDADDSEDDE